MIHRTSLSEAISKSVPRHLLPGGIDSFLDGRLHGHDHPPTANRFEMVFTDRDAAPPLASLPPPCAARPAPPLPHPRRISGYP